MQDTKKIRSQLFKLFGPICMEIFFMMLSGIIDNLMLSSEGDIAVGAVGTANSYLRLITVMFTIASTGMVAVMALYIGAGKKDIAHKARNIGFLFNLALGGSFSLVLFFASEPFLRAIGITGELKDLTAVYMQIVGGACVLNAFIPIFAGHLRAFGETRKPFFAALAANTINIILNAVFLYGLHKGVAGVAAATAISYAVNLIFLVIWSQKMKREAKPDKSVKASNLVKQILHIGVPSACESIIYSLSVTIIVSLLNTFDPTGFSISARSYALQICAFSHCASSAFSQANAIAAGWYMGSKNDADCDWSTKYAAHCSMAMAILLGLLLTLAEPLFMPLFSNDPEMVSSVRILLLINVALEIGRAGNMCYGFALKSLGDARFTMLIGIVFTMLFAAGGTWLLSGVVHMEPSIACFAAMALDECTRAVLMSARWRKGLWRTKTLIDNA